MKRRNKIIREKAIKVIFIVDCIYILFSIIVFGPWDWNNDINEANQMAAIIIVVVSAIIGNILLYSFLHKAYSIKVKIQESIFTVEKQLMENNEVEVIPIRDDIPVMRVLKKIRNFMQHMMEKVRF